MCIPPCHKYIHVHIVQHVSSYMYTHTYRYMYMHIHVPLTLCHSSFDAINSSLQQKSLQNTSQMYYEYVADIPVHVYTGTAMYVQMYHERMKATQAIETTAPLRLEMTSSSVYTTPHKTAK